MKLVVGLGNPGAEYEKTLHNVGFVVVEKLKQFYGARREKKECDALVSECNIAGEKVIFALPQTYMNLSGRALRALQKKYAIKSKDIIVIHDDMDIVRGCVRIRNAGSAGTHKGMKSVLALVSGTNFLRFRVGTGRPENGQLIVDYVLSPIPNSSKIYDGIEICIKAVSAILEGQSFEKVRTDYSK